MLYFIKISCYAALMYGFYLLVLKDRAQHAISRAYLLCCAVAPLLLPAHLPYAWIVPVCVAGALTGHIVLTRALMRRD